MFDFLINFSRLARPLSNIKNIAIIFFAFLLSGAPLNWNLFILGSLSMSFIFSATYAYNTVCDNELDKNNANKRHYYESFKKFSKKGSLVITISLVFMGLFLGYYIGLYFLVSLAVILVIGYLYSSPIFRFKERPYLDIIFGASLTYMFRFIAAWFIFKVSFPPIFPILALIFAKNGGYVTYKIYDREFLKSAGINNSITNFSKKTIWMFSVVSFVLAIILFSFLCLNSIFIYNVQILGSLPINFIFLIFLFIPAAITVYFMPLDKTKVGLRFMRTVGLLALLVLVIIALVMAK